jgi:P-type Ca2+ transporter type 2C
MEALREMTQVDSRVKREGKTQKISADELVPGDIVLIEGGDIVTADLRLLEASKLQANESALTGESEPVSKQVDDLDEDKPLAERNNMLFKGTSVTRGSGEGIVVFTGMDTELGQISELVSEAEEEKTPLEKNLDKLGNRLVWFALGTILIVTVAGLLRGKEFILMIETAVALSVAAIPEGLPIVATIALARGMYRMAERNALINRLAAVETLGGVNVICTDKTGTLTENQMTVTEYLLDSEEVHVSGEGLSVEGEFTQKNEETIKPSDDDLLMDALKVGMLCNNAEIQEEDNGLDTVGEPIEVALLIAGAKAGLQRKKLTEELPESREVAFDPEVKMMATFHEQGDDYFVAVKGAPEAILKASTHVKTQDGKREELTKKNRKSWLKMNTEMASKGLRLLALAEKTTAAADDDPYENLTLLGLVGFHDPPRDDVQKAIQDCKKAGIKVVMVTGDQPVTAQNIAEAVGLVNQEEEVEALLGEELESSEELSEEENQRILSAPIFARVSPKQKLDLITVHQQSGGIVAMTGDGVNDAPALKSADIGIAMGKRGTQVAREAADMVLEDDAFSTIVLAVRQGRVIFNNIRRFVLYLISCNVSEILVVFLATMVDWPLPIQPLQILFLNLVTDVFPALALGMGKGDQTVMEQPPRDPDETVLMKKHWFFIIGYSALITIAVMGAYGIGSVWFGLDSQKTITISFLTLAFSQLWHVFNMRDKGSGFLDNDVVKNKYIWGAIALCIILILAAVYIAPLADILAVVDPGVRGWGLILGMSLLPLIAGQVYIHFRGRETAKS